MDERRAGVLMQRLGMRGDVLIQRLQAIKENTFLEKQNLSTANPNWNSQKDARLLVLRRFIHIFEFTQFNLHLLGKALDEEWYQSIVENKTQQEPEYQMFLTIEWEKVTKYRFGMSLFTLIESSFRVFLRNIDPAACKGATSSFESIYKSLLGPKHLDLARPDRELAEELLNFIRTIRNLIHNDGVFFDEKGKDKVITYRGVPYNFNNGKPVEFVTWELLLDLAENIQRLLVQVISNPFIISQTDLVDPFMSYFI